MIKVHTLKVDGFPEALWGMRNPKNSWNKSDTKFAPETEAGCWIGEHDWKLALQLASAGSVHGKFRRMIVVWVDITAPLYWWKEFDTYKVGTVANSCSTMHTLHKRDLLPDDFSSEHLMGTAMNCLVDTINTINHFRRLYVKAVEENDPIAKDWWWQMIQLLPTSFNQKRTVFLNYEVLSNIMEYRQNHKLDEWRDFCLWVEKLPYSELITGVKQGG